MIDSRFGLISCWLRSLICFRPTTRQQLSAARRKWRRRGVPAGRCCQATAAGDQQCLADNVPVRSTTMSSSSRRREAVRLSDVFRKIAGMWHSQDALVAPADKEGPLITAAGILKLEDIESETSAFMALHQRLEEELRAAKRAQLSCGEVLLPPDLLHRIAHDVLKMAESEPCGLRGCTLYLNFEGEQECRKIGTIKCDTNTVSTFELFLTLKQNPRNAWSLIPLFIRNFTSGGTIVIDHEFTIEKRKLYRSFLE